MLNYINIGKTRVFLSGKPLYTIEFHYWYPFWQDEVYSCVRAYVCVLITLLSLSPLCQRGYAYQGVCSIGTKQIKRKVFEMAIRIVHNGNPATRIPPVFDECIIESLVESDSSFVMDLRNGNPIFKRIRSDEETVNFIADLHEEDAIASVRMDEENRDIIITLRELGEEPIDVGEIPPTDDEGVGSGCSDC